MGKTVTICFTNNKGGSGKSTTCSNLGAAMARAGKKVLLVDGDMQLNLSLAFFPEDWVLEHAQGEKNLYHAIGKQEDLTDYIVHTPYENLDLVPSSTLMSSIEYELFTKWQREFILRKCLQKVKDSEVYDYILIDTPPMASVIDAAIVGGVCDGAILVIEDGTVGYRTAQKVKAQLEKSGSRVLGAVLNKVEMKKGKYYSYDKYGKYSKYGRYGKY